MDAVLRDLAEAADRWEAVLEQAATITYSVDMGDLQVSNADGKLVDLALHPSVRGYSHHELGERLNFRSRRWCEEAQTTTPPGTAER